MADVVEAQRKALVAIIGWAARVRDALQPILDQHGDRVHFRPARDGFAMVGLLPERPMQGKRHLTDPEHVVRDFEELFNVYCRDIARGWQTPAKDLQSSFIRDAQMHDRHLVQLNRASEFTADPVDLAFVVDDVTLPGDGGDKKVGGLLALRRDGGRSTPVLIEIKSDRSKARHLGQLDGYAPLIELHRELFGALFSVVLGESVSLVGPVEKWMLWPRSGQGPDRREAELAERGVRVVGYTGSPETGGYVFNVGRPVAGRAALINADLQTQCAQGEPATTCGSRPPPSVNVASQVPTRVSNAAPREHPSSPRRRRRQQ